MIEETMVDVDGVEVFLRRTPGHGPPVLFVHGNPSHSGDWMAFLERLEGPSVALDLPGWGRSERPDLDRFDGSMNGLASFLDRFLETQAIGAYRLVLHDRGSVPPEFGRLYAERLPNAELVELPDAAHWPWIDRPDLIDGVIRFLEPS